MSIKIGDIITVTITGIQPYGAFANIDNEMSGLIHISEISNGFVRDVHQFVEVNDRVRVKVIDIDHNIKQARLSIKALKNSHRKERTNMRTFKQGNMELGFSSLKEALPKWIDEKYTKITK